MKNWGAPRGPSGGSLGKPSLNVVIPKRKKWICGPKKVSKIDLRFLKSIVMKHPKYMVADIRQVHLQVFGHPLDCYIQKKLTEPEDALQEGRQKKPAE